MKPGDVLIFDTGKFRLETINSNTFTAKGPFHKHGANTGSYITLKQGYSPNFKDLKDHITFGPVQIGNKAISMRIEYFQPVNKSSTYYGFGEFHLTEKDRLIINNYEYSFKIHPYPGGYLDWAYQIKIESDAGSGWRCDGDSFYSTDLKAIMTLKVVNMNDLQVTVSEYTPNPYASLDELRPGDSFKFDGIRFQVRAFEQAGHPLRKAVEISNPVSGTGASVEAGKTRKLGDYSITVHSIEEDNTSRRASINIEKTTK